MMTTTVTKTARLKGSTHSVVDLRDFLADVPASALVRITSAPPGNGTVGEAVLVATWDLS